MSIEPTTIEKLRGLRWSIASNAANTFFVQFTFFGSVFILFLSELGLSKSQMGLLLSLLPFSGFIALLIAPKAARYGYKRTFLTFFGARKIAGAFLLLTPWVLTNFGPVATVVYVTTIVALFALCRAAAETARFPWIQEYVPNSVRGKYSATNNVFTTLAGLVAVAVASFVIGRTEGLTGFMGLIAAGVLFGLISVWTASFIPGGASVQAANGERLEHRDLREAIADKGFTRYLVGAGLVTLATVPMVSFLPLFMQEQVGLSAGNVVSLQTGTLLGGLFSGYLWGWTADRYGSRPVTLSGISMILFLPLFWLIMPRQSEWSLEAAFAIALFQGVADMGWAIGSARLLYVSVVPPEKKRDYMALYYAWIGLVGGISQLVGGWVLQYSQDLSGQLFIFRLDPYVPLFVLGLTLGLLSLLFLQQARADTAVGVGQFAGMFLRGNPFTAMTSMIRYHLAKNEQATVTMTERMGQTKSPLTVDEMLEALGDPRFNVRYEAIISIARMRPDERLIKALIEVLEDNEPALSVTVAWALGRLGDERAVEALREALDSGYRSVRAHGARSLGTLGDVAVIPVLLERLASEPDHGLQVAFASALGQLRAGEATDMLLALLQRTEAKTPRMELALALARIVGDEHLYINLVRQTRQEIGTAASLALTTAKRRAGDWLADHGPLEQLIDQCALALARNELDEGVQLLCQILCELPEEHLTSSARLIVEECAERLDQYGIERLEYLLLALHTLNSGWEG